MTRITHLAQELEALAHGNVIGLGHKTVHRHQNGQHLEPSVSGGDQGLANVEGVRQ